jgi:small subunit ribosomal protein S8
MMQDALADVLTTIRNAEKIGRKECITNAGKMIKSVLKIMHENKYIGPFELIDNGKGGKFKIELKGKIVHSGVIKPRLSVRVDELEKYEKRFLPAENVGLLILSTSKGVMDHKKAKELHIGGKLISYVY